MPSPFKWDAPGTLTRRASIRYDGGPALALAEPPPRAPRAEPVLGRAEQPAAAAAPWAAGPPAAAVKELVLAMAQSSDAVRTWFAAAKALGQEEFCRKHAHPFLIQEVASAEAPGADKLEFSTQEVTGGDDSIPLLSATTVGNLRVVKVVKRDSRIFVGMVGVGRADNNDIVQDHPAVSKFHAYFTRDPLDERLYSVTDAGSTNGTYVNGVRLKPHDPQRLSPRDLVSFGKSLGFRFHLPDTFHELVRLVAD
jgi:hypothetical protein